MNRTIKRVAAAALAVIMVAGTVPANTGFDKLFGVTAIVASAAEKSESITTIDNNSFTGEHFSIIGNGYYHASYGIYLGGYGGPTITISALNGETISKIEAVIGYAQNVGSDTVEADNGTVSGDLTQGSTITVSDIDSSSVSLSFTSSEFGHLILLKSFVIYYEVKADPTYAPVLAQDLTYNGSEQNLVTNNGGEGGTIHYVYRKSGDTAWTAVASGFPQAKDAGTYEVG